MAVKYGRGKFAVPERYIAYMNMIADSPAYKGLPNIREDNGKINWQCSSGKTTSFYKFFPGRFAWWVKKADELNIPGTENSDDRFTIAARMIHPTKKKVCLICGNDRHVGYMYLNANLAKQWNKLIQNEFFEKTMPIYEAVEILISELGLSDAREQILSDFPEKKDDIALFDAGEYETFFSKTQHIRSTKLSPGYMGDCPHRLDGLHDYCTFCRKGNDPGRSDSNMRTYNHDRRAFEWWAEGDWKVADTLYNSASTGICVNCGREVKKISPDHIGPLSCGFKQNGFFEPLCGRCNSAKNRRFTLENVESLIEYEITNNDSVASWQVQSLWDSAKHEMSSDEDVKILSNYMRAMQDYYLRILTYIAKLGHYEFLTSFLHPEYANYTVEFTGLNSSTLSFDCYVKVPNSTNGSRSLAARSVRIAFEELFEYSSKSTAQRKSLILNTVDEFLSEDEPQIESIFADVPFTETDQDLQTIITAQSTSVEEKDAAIQTIIERDSFTDRMSKYHSKFAELKGIVDPRGVQFSTQCLDEIKNS